MMVEVVCHRCNKICSVDRKIWRALLPKIEKLAPGEAFKFNCNFCGPGRGIGKVPDICYFCRTQSLEKAKDGVIFCTVCNLTQSSMKRCPRCGHINDPNARYCDCGVRLLPESSEKGYHYTKTPKFWG